MTLYETYSANRIEKIVDAINCLCRNLTSYKKMLGGSQPYWYKGDTMERRITHIILNGLLYLHEISVHIWRLD